MRLFHLREQGFRNTKIKSASALLGLKRYEDPIKTQQEVYTPWTNPSHRRKFKQRATLILHWDDSVFKPHCPLAASLSLIPVSSDDNNPWTQRLTECMGWADVCADTQRTAACGSKGNMCLRKWLLRAALQGRHPEQEDKEGGERMTGEALKTEPDKLKVQSLREWLISIVKASGMPGGVILMNSVKVGTLTGGRHYPKV